MKDSSNFRCRPTAKILLLWALPLFLSGCVYQKVPGPVIVGDYKSPHPLLPPKAPAPSTQPYPAGWVPTGVPERNWKIIVIHHSATATGNMAEFDKEHRGRGWDGIGYDFVIGNGNGSPDGQVEVTFRWAKQREGAHVGGTPANWVNEQGIGICLIGDFNRISPSSRQMQSLTKLVAFLQKRYGISDSHIYGHGTTPGSKGTDCPGRNFPMARFKAGLAAG